jgi:hypothetical protein
MQAPDKTLNDRIWAGDRTAVIEVANRYFADPAGQLVPLASTLYSFRQRPECAAELVVLRPDLVARAERIALGPRGGDPVAEANEADVVSTVLAWMARCVKMDETDRRHAIRAAKDACREGLNRLFALREHVRPGGHTELLLEVTLARLLIAEGNPKAALAKVRAIATLAPRIADPNQRARVYRSVGILLRSQLRFFRGVGWGIRAALVPGSSGSVRLKSLAAFVGPDH